MTHIQISIMTSIGSLAFGACAWLLGVLAITNSKAFSSYRNTAFSFVSCLISLFLQLFEVQNRVQIGDYAAIEDTIGAVLFAVAVLIFTTIALNVVALIKAKKK